MAFGILETDRIVSRKILKDLQTSGRGWNPKEQDSYLEAPAPT
jgi:hypothetical protein